MVSKTIPVKPFDLVIFGATGDLAKRKIIPALFRRFIAGQIPLMEVQMQVYLSLMLMVLVPN